MDASGRAQKFSLPGKMEATDVGRAILSGSKDAKGPEDVPLPMM